MWLINHLSGMHNQVWNFTPIYDQDGPSEGQWLGCDPNCFLILVDLGKNHEPPIFWWFMCFLKPPNANKWTVLEPWTATEISTPTGKRMFQPKKQNQVSPKLQAATSLPADAPLCHLTSKGLRSGPDAGSSRFLDYTRRVVVWTTPGG